MESAEPIIVTPGRRLGLAQEYTAGPGTYVRSGMIYSSVLGHMSKKSQEDEKTISVERESVKFAIPVVGSEVIGRVIRINPRAATVAIVMVGNVTCQEDFQGIVRVQDIRSTEKDSVEVINSFRPGDIIRAQVISLGDQRSYYLSTVQNSHGVVFAQSSDGNTMVPISWEEMQDPKTQVIEKRKCAKLF